LPSSSAAEAEAEAEGEVETEYEDEVEDEDAAAAAEAEAKAEEALSSSSSVSLPAPAPATARVCTASGERTSRLCSRAASRLEEEEGGGLRAMIVLLLKQMHLQNEVAVDLALRVGWMRRDREMRIRRTRRGGKDSGEVGRRRRIVVFLVGERNTAQVLGR
jgi:predicted component of type VI protein secretion system